MTSFNITDFSEGPLRAERDSRGVVTLTLDDPKRFNALGHEMLAALQQALDDVARDDSVRVVVLTGAGPKAFVAGADIAEMNALTPVQGRDFSLRGTRMMRRVEKLNKPVIAMINGFALGGGLELAMAADLRIAVKQAKFGNPEATLGMIPGWMGTTRLAEMIGPARARHLLLLASPIPAAQACDWGLITAIAEDMADLDTQLAAWLDRLLANGPSAMALIKGLLENLHRNLRQHHASAVAQAAATEDCKEGVRAFIEKRKAVYRNC